MEIYVHVHGVWFGLVERQNMSLFLVINHLIGDALILTIAKTYYVQFI